MLIFPDPSDSTEYTDPNGSVWQFNGTGWVRQCQPCEGGGNEGGGSDPYWSNVSLLINADDLPDGAGDGSKFIDSGPYNLTVTPTGDVTQALRGPVDNTYAAEFSGGDWLDMPNSSNYRPNTGSYCVEGWFMVHSDDSLVLVDFRTAGFDDARPCIWATNGVLRVWDGQQERASDSGVVIKDRWHHVVLSRAAGKTSCYVDGNRIWSVAGSLQLYNFVPKFGARLDGQNTLHGKLSDWRISVGADLYDGGTTIPVPTDAVGLDPSTKAYLEFAAVGIFDLTGKNEISAVNGAKVSTSEFKYGTGSVDVTASNAYLEAPASSDWHVENGDYTVEFWAKGSAAGTTIFVSSGTTSGASQANWFVETVSGRMEIYISDGSSYTIVKDPSSWASYGDGWHHVAWVNSTGQSTLYIDGEAKGTATTPSTNNFSVPLGVGAVSGTLGFDGYIDDLRITKGIARYTADFIPPEKHPVKPTLYAARAITIDVETSETSDQINLIDNDSEDA